MSKHSLHAPLSGVNFEEKALVSTPLPMALLQVPAGIMAERMGERVLISGGTLVTGLAYLTLGSMNGHLTLLAVLLVGGTGATVQHALCSSLISKAYENGPRREALGIYNFAGDLGKMIVPFLVAIVISGFGWRIATTGIGVFGITSALIAFLLFFLTRPCTGKAIRRAKTVITIFFIVVFSTFF